MFDTGEIITLSTIAGGALEERFEEKLREVLANMMDPNTPTTTTRKVVMTVSLKPDEKRTRCDIDISVESKTAAPIKVSTTLFMAMGKDGPLAQEHHPDQMRLNLGAMIPADAAAE
jgi:hypothetical protein